MKISDDFCLQAGDKHFPSYPVRVSMAQSFDPFERFGLAQFGSQKKAFRFRLMLNVNVQGSFHMDVFCFDELLPIEI